ncbi:unnamed protein product, partial [Dovyalis caffra]
QTDGHCLFLKKALISTLDHKAQKGSIELKRLGVIETTSRLKRKGKPRPWSLVTTIFTASAI